MLVHYTRNINSAMSIIKSRQLWLMRLGTMSDQNEILHYLKEFNRLHYSNDLIAHFSNVLKLLRVSRSNHQQKLFMDAFVSAQMRKESFQNGVSIGGSLAKFLRQYSYLICFTREEASEFHSAAYGDIAFVFDDNPLIPRDEFQLFFNNVQYIDSEKIKTLQMEDGYRLNQLIKTVTNEPDVRLIEIVEIYHKQLIKNISRYSEVIRDIIHDLTELNSSIEFSSLEYENMKEITNFIHSIIMEDWTRNFRNSIGKTKPHRSEIKEIIAKNADMARTTWFNLMGCLVKDQSFKEDNETRAIILPKNKNYFNRQERYIPFNFDVGKLKKIIVSESCENRDTVKSELISLLLNEGYQKVMID